MSGRVHEAYCWMPRRIYSAATTIPPQIVWGLAYVRNGVVVAWIN